MCEVCGCDSGAKVTAVNLQTGKVLALDREHVHADGTRHSHPHPHDHGHEHHHGHDHHHRHELPPTTLVELGARILAKNDSLAERNRAWLAERHILALNLMSAPGAGKTTLLECTIRDLKD